MVLKTEFDWDRYHLEELEFSTIPALKGFRKGNTGDPIVNRWERYYWSGLSPTGHVVKIEYPRDYPKSAPLVFVSPEITTHHEFEKGNLCLMLPGEWSQNYTAASIALITFKFLAEHKQGLTDPLCGRILRAADIELRRYLENPQARSKPLWKKILRAVLVEISR